MQPPRLFIAVLMTLAAASSLSAQDQAVAPLVPQIVKQVLLDPTTYAPSMVAWGATRLDWRSSQVFFENGLVEHNSRFTLSGRADAGAVSYGDGNRRILLDAVANLQLSVVNNVSERVVEHLLLPRFPNHRKLVRTLGWVERSVVASYWTYRLSADHFRQWQENGRRAQQLGYD